MARHAANDSVLAEGRRVLIDDDGRGEHVAVVGVDDHVWRYIRHGEKYGTVMIDLTLIRDDTAPARLVETVEGRSKSAFTQWLAARGKAWRDGVEVVAMDGFAGFKTATAEDPPDATAVMDPFHIVRLPGDPLDRCRRRVQLDLHSHRRRAAAPPPIRRAGPCIPAPPCSPTSGGIGSRHCSPARSTSSWRRPEASTNA